MDNTHKSDNKTKTILFVHQGHELYGSDRSLLSSIKAAKMVNPGVVVDVVLPSTGVLYDTIEAQFKIKPIIKKLGVLRKYDLKRFRFRVVPRLLTFFRHIPFLKQYDVIIVNTAVIIDVMVALRFVKNRTIVHIREIFVGAQKVLFSSLLKFSKAEIVFVSKAAQNGCLFLSKTTKHVVWNGCKPIPFMEKNEMGGILKLLVIGRINNWKGQSLAVKAIGIMSEKLKEKVSLIIAGGVYGKQQHLVTNLKILINENKIEKQVKIVPFTNKPEELYKNADIVIVPSTLPEPFGRVAIEAMSIGKPVIAANHGGLTEIVVDGETGILFEAGNPQSLAEAITYFIENRAKLSEMGEKGRVRYQENFTEEHYIERLGIVLQQKKL